MRKQDYYEPSIGRESEPRRRPKKKKKRANRGERAAVTLLSLLFLVVAAAAVSAWSNTAARLWKKPAKCSAQRW